MPGIFTHFISGEKVLEKITDKIPLNLLTKTGGYLISDFKAPTFLDITAFPLKRMTA